MFCDEGYCGCVVMMCDWDFYIVICCKCGGNFWYDFEWNVFFDKKICFFCVFGKYSWIVIFEFYYVVVEFGF